MKDTVVVDIKAPQRRVATLYADPSNNTQWMTDVQYYEPVSGAQGVPGSKYRLIPKRGSMSFTATVMERNLPKELRLNLDSPTVSVDVRGTLSTLPDGKTRLVSVEVIKFKGVWRKVLSPLARPAIHKAHRRHMEAFKHFAERQQ